MPKSTFLANAVLANLLKSVALPWAAQATYFVALHSADPGLAGTQATSEIVYTGYARQSIDRTGTGLSVATNVGQNAVAVNFPACTAGSATATFFSIGLLVSGAGSILYSGALTSSLAIAAGVTPIAAIGAITLTET